MISELVDYLQSKGWRHREKGGQVWLLEPCPFCGGKGKLYFHGERGTWRCNKCDERGNILTMKRRLGDLQEVAKPVGYYFGVKDRPPAQLAVSRPPGDLVPRCHQRLLQDEDALDYVMEARGFSLETVAQFQLGLAQKGGKRYLTIPHVQGGVVVNLKYRSLPPAQKFFCRWPGGPSVLFNSDAIEDLASLPPRERVVVLCEGETDAMAWVQVGYPRAVSSTAGAGSLQEEWLRLLEPATTVLLAYDSDEAGEAGAQKAAATLGRWRCKRVTPLLHDFAEMVAAGMGRAEFDQCVRAAQPFDQDHLRPGSSFLDEMMARLAGDQPRGRPTGWMSLDRLLGGLRDGELTVVTGDTGCLAGDTVVGINRAMKGQPITLAELVRRQNGGKAGGKLWRRNIPTMIQSVVEPDYWGLAQVVRAIDAGAQDTVEVVFSNGSKLVGTEDHKVMTPEGAWLPLGGLAVGTDVACKAPAKKGDLSKPRYRQVGGLRYHPNATHPTAEHTPYRVPYHRLVVEAAGNNVPLCEYIEALRRGPCSFVFLEKDQCIHHVDGDSSNNEIKNLRLVSKAEHNRLHARDDQAWKNFGLNAVGACSVQSIRGAGKQQTYDLTVAGTHNYLANGIVTHNSGKSTWTTALALNQMAQDHSVLVAPFEGRPWEVLAKLLSMRAGRSAYEMTPEERAEVAPLVRDLPLFLLDRHGPTPLQDIKDVIYHAVHRYGVQTVILDHLHYLLAAGGDDERKAIDHAVREIKGWTLDLRIHIVLVVHPSKLQTDQKGRLIKPSLNNLKGSSAIKQETDNGILVWRHRSTEPGDTDHRAEVTVLKCRSPAGREGSIWLDFVPGAELFEDNGRAPGGWASSPPPPRTGRDAAAETNSRWEEEREERAGPWRQPY